MRNDIRNAPVFFPDIFSNFEILTFFVYCHEYQITALPYGVEFHQYPCIGFRLRHFRCKEFYPLVLWIWNQNIAISTIVGNSSHNMIQVQPETLPKNSNLSSCLQNIKLKNNTT
jgi:hypothetical protein